VRPRAAAYLALAWIACPASASAAYSGAITNVHRGPAETVVATYSSRFDVCLEDGFCGWYPHAYQVPAWQSCRPDSGHLTYVGDLHFKPATERGTDEFFPAPGRVRICLYVSGPDDRDYFLADYVYDPSGAPSPPSTPPSGVGPLTVSQARSLVPGVLRRRYHRDFTLKTLTRRCAPLTPNVVRCEVEWRKHGRHRGQVTLWNDRDGKLYTRVRVRPRA